MHDKNGKEIVLQDYVATEIVGVQIGTQGHKLWVCIDGVAVLRVMSPKIELDDLQSFLQEKINWGTSLRRHGKIVRDLAMETLFWLAITYGIAHVIIANM